jgi:hypothetical protein
MFSLLSVLFFQLIYASPNTISGDFQFNGDVEVLQRIHRDFIWAGSQQGREQLRRFRRQGYSCQFKFRQLYQCKKFLSPKLSDGMRGKLIQIGEDAGLASFGELKSRKQTVHSLSYQEWRVEQSISFLGVEFPDYKFMTINGHLSKVYFKLPHTLGNGFVLEGEKLKWMVSKRENNIDYLVMLNFERIE